MECLYLRMYTELGIQESDFYSIGSCGAERGTRTPTPLLRAADFKSAASASSAIPARDNSFYIVAALQTFRMA